MKLAILQMAHPSQVESAAYMLRLAGYEARYCGPRLRCQLTTEAECKTVAALEGACHLGLHRVSDDILPAEPEDVDRCDLFCEIKRTNLPKIVRRWPRLADRICWWPINGGRPEANSSEGDLTNCPWPVTGPHLWYGEPEFNGRGRNHVYYPPHARADDYLKIDRKSPTGAPFCLCHGVRGWGYAAIVDDVRARGVRVYGQGAPDGVVQHRSVAELCETASCMVHLKGEDCPGWALYEALLSACPIVLPRWLVRRSHMEALFDETTCALFGPYPNDDHRGDPEYPRCVDEIGRYVEALKDPQVNRRVGEAGRRRLLDLMWRPDRDLPAFLRWLAREFPR